MNTTATSEQLRKAKEDFLKRTEPFMNELAKLAQLKKPIFQLRNHKSDTKLIIN